MPIAHVNGTELHYHAKGSGVPVIFIHPPLLNSAIFRYQQVQLSDEYKIITFDIRGHGYSAHSDEEVTIPLVVSDMIALLDKLDIDQAYVCGYSAGGAIALEALLEAPSRFIGGVVASGMSEVRDISLKSKLIGAEFLSMPLFIRLLNLGVSYGNADMGLTFKNLYRHAKHGNIDNIRQYYRASHLFNCTDRLHYISSPLLVMYGEHDELHRKYSELILRRLPLAKRAVIRDEGHYLFTKGASKTNEVLRAWFKYAEEQQPDKPVYRGHPSVETPAIDTVEPEHTHV
ncbi:alpha/beta fold hydrolase [Paenibacillus chartarius]|uniref:Alpha/beta fold hydrolase n=1 Tax=Paenibacillus chartarius TaxID=747481 RepID=A0ABV6DHG2_9BACL